MSYAKPPVLNGSAKSDYENYLRTDELLNLQKGPEDWQHRDELLFTVVHQVSELWLKLASSEVGEAISSLSKNEPRIAQRLLNRAVLSIHQIHGALDMLERMSPWDYQQVRRALGHGSGFDSPGFNQLRKMIPQLWEEFQRLLRDEQIDLMTLYLQDRAHEDLYQLAEWLVELDERISLWRTRHYKVVERSIGANVQGTQGTPVEVLSRLNSFSFFPELWDVRTKITLHAMEAESNSVDSP
jgi:tryptophan 2,3-dioxygenase